MTESTIRKVGDIDVVELSGRLSLGDALMSIEESILTLIQQGSRRLVIDVAGVTAMDSAGMGMLIACSGQMELHQGKLRLAGAQGAIARTFGVVHIDRLTPVDANVEASCRAFE